MGVAVAALAAQALVHFPITTLSIDELHWQAQFVAASRIRAHLGQLAFSDWLRPLMSHLLGSFERASSIEARVRRIAEATLDQPPGEVERIGVGLGRRLESRLDRALRRSFFTPESPDLAQWIGTQTGHREANQSD